MVISFLLLLLPSNFRKSGFIENLFSFFEKYTVYIYVLYSERIDRYGCVEISWILCVKSLRNKCLSLALGMVLH